MRFRPALSPRPAAATVFLLQIVFLLAAAAPNMAWCHRPGGETVLEFEVAAGACPYIQSAQVGDDGWKSPAGAGQPGTTALKTSHPAHKEIDSEASRSSSSIQRPVNPGPAVPVSVAALGPTLPGRAPSHPAPALFRPAGEADPSGAAALRC